MLSYSYRLHIFLKSAMKKIKLRKLSKDYRNLADTEASRLTGLSNENILHAVTAYHEKKTLYIVTGFCDQGDLAGFLVGRKGELLDEQRIVEWFRQICSALEVNALAPFLLVLLICLVSDTFTHSFLAHLS